MYFVGPLPLTKDGHRSILNICDKLTKTIRIISLPENYDAPFVAKKFINEVYRHNGLPEKIISDRDSIFMGKFWDALFKALEVKIAPSTAHHPQTDGQTEILNRKVEEMIRAFSNHHKDNWDDYLVEFEVNYNSAIHSTTLHSPLFINYGIEPKIIPAQMLPSTPNPSVNEFLRNIQYATKVAHDYIIRKNISMEAYANKKRIARNFKKNRSVWLSTKNRLLYGTNTSRKLQCKYCGPFRILKQIKPVTFKLELSQIRNKHTIL